MPCSRQVTIRLCTMPTCFAPSSVQQKFQFFRLRKYFHNRKSWNFCWTELGAKHIGIGQSLIVTCRLHGIDPYTYLVDVLKRVGQHPAAHVATLTPRLWKTYFAA